MTSLFVPLLLLFLVLFVAAQVAVVKAPSPRGAKLLSILAATLLATLIPLLLLTLSRLGKADEDSPLQLVTILFCLPLGVGSGVVLHISNLRTIGKR